MNADYKYKIELHAHSYPASGCADLRAGDVVRRYSEAGVAGLALTNHFTAGHVKYDKGYYENFLHDFYEAKKAGDSLGVRVYLGAEIRFENSWNDYLVYGIDEVDLKKIAGYLPLGIKRYITAFRGSESVIIGAHPFRFGMDEPQGGTDGTEGYNMHEGHDSRNHLALAHARKYNHIITAGTDFHHAHQVAGAGLILAKTLPEDSFALAKLLKSRDFLLEINGKVIS